MKILKFARSRIALFAPILALILTACGPDRFDTALSTSLVLPPVIQYEEKFLSTAADEAEQNFCPAHIELGKDYKFTRDKLRIAHQSLEKR